MLFIAGYHASGKSVLAKHLEDHFGLLHIETSAIVRSYKEQDNPGASMKEWAQGKELQYGKYFFDELILATIKDVYRDRLSEGSSPQDIVITGNRSLSGIQYLAEHLEGINNQSARIIAVKSTDEDLYDRYRERNRMEGDSEMSLDEFRKLMNDERDTGIEEIFRYADHVLINRGTERDFINSAEQLCLRELGLRDYRNERDVMQWGHEGDNVPRS
jgi:dephospho-CoA kinase